MSYHFIRSSFETCWICLQADCSYSTIIIYTNPDVLPDIVNVEPQRSKHAHLHAVESERQPWALLCLQTGEAEAHSNVMLAHAAEAG